MAVELIHKLVPGAKNCTLLALHGAGGDENDLVQVSRAIAPGAAVLSPRLDAATSAAALAEWLAAQDLKEVYAFAYGAGADLAADLLLAFPDRLQGCVLLRPRRLSTPDPLPKLAGKPVLIAGGVESQALGKVLAEAGAAVDFALAETGDELGPKDFAMAKRWLAQYL